MEDIEDKVNKIMVMFTDVIDEAKRLNKENKETEGKNIRLWNENERLKKRIEELEGKK
jgi:predicted nuclease with TOPRIM domain